MSNSLKNLSCYLSNKRVLIFPEILAGMRVFHFASLMEASTTRINVSYYDYGSSLKALLDDIGKPYKGKPLDN